MQYQNQPSQLPQSVYFMTQKGLSRTTSRRKSYPINVLLQCLQDFVAAAATVYQEPHLWTRLSLIPRPSPAPVFDRLPRFLHTASDQKLDQELGTRLVKTVNWRPGTLCILFWPKNVHVWIHCNTWSNLMQEIQLLEFMGGSNLTHAHSNYFNKRVLPCMHCYCERQ